MVIVTSVITDAYIERLKCFTSKIFLPVLFIIYEAIKVDDVIISYIIIS